MGERAFPVDNIPSIHGGSSRNWAARIECHKCGKIDHFSKPREKPVIMIEQHFRKVGWFVGNGPRNDICPDCQKPAQITKEKPALRVVQPSSPTAHISGIIPSDGKQSFLPSIQTDRPPVQVEPPRQMSRDDRRIIFSKIDQFYDTDRYTAPWTDFKIAQDLGVPQAWVAQVRDEMFGPAGSNEEIDKFLVQVAALQKDCDAFNKRVEAMVIEARNIAARTAELLAEASKLRKAVGK